jgi:hypothetical protein
MFMISVADPDPDPHPKFFMPNPDPADPGPDPRPQNWRLINLFSVGKVLWINLNTTILTFQLINKSCRPFQGKNILLQNFIQSMIGSGSVFFRGRTGIRIRIKMISIRNTVYDRWVNKNVTNCNRFLLFPYKFVTSRGISRPNPLVNFCLFSKVVLLYSRAGAGAASKNFQPGAASK